MSRITGKVKWFNGGRGPIDFVGGPPAAPAQHNVQPG
jgi:hypothetical protein